MNAAVLVVIFHLAVFAGLSFVAASFWRSYRNQCSILKWHEATHAEAGKTIRALKDQRNGVTAETLIANTTEILQILRDLEAQAASCYIRRLPAPPTPIFIKGNHMSTKLLKLTFLLPQVPEEGFPVSRQLKVTISNEDRSTVKTLGSFNVPLTDTKISFWLPEDWTAELETTVSDAAGNVSVPNLLTVRNLDTIAPPAPPAPVAVTDESAEKSEETFDVDAVEVEIIPIETEPEPQPEPQPEPEPEPEPEPVPDDEGGEEGGEETPPSEDETVTPDEE
jgi:hypothetical protein